MNIYVGNLSFNATEDDLRKAFESFGQVNSVSIIKDNYSGKSRGFGFVEMPESTEAQEAISQLNERELVGRALKVNEARPRAQRRGRGGGQDRGRRNDRGGNNSW